MKQLWRADFCHIFWGSFVPYFVATELILGKNMNKKIQSGKGTRWPFFDALQMSLIDVQIKIDIIWVIHLYLLSVQLFCQKKNPFVSNQLKTQKERLESKEVHMNLLRQKIAQLQQEKQARTALAEERDEAQLSLRKLEKKVERLQRELSACQEYNTELKAKLADTNELKASVWLLSLSLSVNTPQSIH